MEQEAVKQQAALLLEKLGFAPESITVEQAADRLAVKLVLPIQEAGILIGFHGEMLYSFQLLLSLMNYKRLGKWQPIAVNINNYREERESSLRQLALNSAQKVKFSGQAVVLPHFSSPERRLIHMALADHPDVVTESVGEGRERRLVVKPKEARPTTEDKEQSVKTEGG